jgi:hypothetical protein
MLIWQPTPTLPLLQSAPDTARQPAGLGLAALAGPVYPARVSIGIAIVLAGVFGAQTILELVLRASQGALSISSHLQAQLISWEIAALITVFGAGIAGSSTFNGIKQGICVGFAAAIIIAGFHFANPRVSFDMMLLTACSALLLSIVGGWFGGTLFPPVLPKRRRLATDY